MGYPKPALEIPRVLGDNAAELDAGIKRLASEFFETDGKLALPLEYHAKPTGDRSSASKLYMVEGLTVRRHWSDWENKVSRRVDLPPVFGGSVTKVEAEIERLVIEFFGSAANIVSYHTECKVVVVPDARGDKKYKVEGVTVTQPGKWPEA